MVTGVQTCALPISSSVFVVRPAPVSVPGPGPSGVEPIPAERMLRESSGKSLCEFYPPLPYGWAGATGRRPLRRAVTTARELRTRRGKQEVDDVRVLVVEDESYLADAIALGLRRETMAVDVVGDGAEALAQVEFTDYDVVVLDGDLPGVHGDEVCARLAREHPDVKVLMLTAARSLRDRVEGFEIGAKLRDRKSVV